MPTKSRFWSLNKLQLTSYANVEPEVGAVRVQYESWYHSNSCFDAEFGAMTVEDTLDMIIEAFTRVTPMPVKSGEMVFLCNCVTVSVNMRVNIQGPGTEGTLHAVEFETELSRY
jgi:hypothetical protein